MPRSLLAPAARVLAAAIASLVTVGEAVAQTDPLEGGAASPAAGAAPMAGAAPANGAGPGWITWVMMLGVFAIFYFLILRPQQKRANQHKQFLEGLQVGASVVTSGGIYGKVVGMEDQIVRIEIADRVQLRVHKSHVAGAAANAAEALANQQK